MDNEQMSAQSDQGDVQAQPQQQAAPAQDPNEGFQKRIDQLTAKIHERDQMLMDLQSKVLEATLRNQGPQPQAQPEPDPLAQFNGQLDETVARAVKAATEAVASKFQAQLAQQQQSFTVELNAMQVDQVAGMQGIDIPEKVRQQAKATVKQFRTSPEVALKLALGEYYMEKAKQVSGVAGYVPPSAPVLTQGAPVPAPVKQSARPANFDQLSPAQQVAWYESNGFDDAPF